MIIDNLTIGEAKELASFFGQSTSNNARKKHPLHGKNVVAVLPHGLVFFGRLNDPLDESGRYAIENAHNVRYLTERNGGLHKLAAEGPINGDKIDASGIVYVETAVYFVECGDWANG